MSSAGKARCLLIVSSLATLAACGNPASDSGGQFLYIWMGDIDHDDPDFLAVVDANRESVTYGEVVTTRTVDLYESLPHHTEYEMPPSGELLFANAHVAEKVLLFDFTDPAQPTLARTLDPIPPYRYPHDMVRMPNGNVLIGFLRSEGPSPLADDPTDPGGHGGVVEVTPHGDVVRSASAADAITDVPIRPYSFAMLPEIDRMVLTSAPMVEPHSADVVQIWRLSSLELLTTLPVPPAVLPSGELLITQLDGEPAPSGHRMPFEPRVMPDGSVLLNAFGCGFYRVSNIDTEPRIDNVYTIEVPSTVDLGACGIPVVAGQFWVMTVGNANMLVTLDVSDPAAPHEVFRLPTEDGFAPHWLAKDPRSNRLIVGAENGGENRMLMALIDEDTGALSWDEILRAKHGIPGIDFRRDRWPHGETGEAFGHAALFGR